MVSTRKRKPPKTVSPPKSPSPTETPENMSSQSQPCPCPLNIILSTQNKKTLLRFNSSRNTHKTKAMEKNFQELMFQVAQDQYKASLPPSATALIKDRVKQLFSNYKTPDHPPYSAMIEKSIRELNEKGGSSEESISEFLKTEYKDLPWAHPTLLIHHLSRLCESRDIVLTRGGKYMLGGAEESNNPNPGAKCRRKPQKRRWKRDWERELNRSRRKQKKNRQKDESIVEGNGKEKVEEMFEKPRFKDNEDNGEELDKMEDDLCPEPSTPERPPGFEHVIVENTSRDGFALINGSCLQKHGTEVVYCDVSSQMENLDSRSGLVEQNDVIQIEEATKVQQLMQSKKGKKKLISFKRTRNRCEKERNDEAEEYPVALAIVERSSQEHMVDDELKMEKSRRRVRRNSKQLKKEMMLNALPLAEDPTEGKDQSPSKELSGSDRAVRQFMRWTRHTKPKVLVTKVSVEQSTASKPEDHHSLTLKSSNTEKPSDQETEPDSSPIMDQQQQVDEKHQSEFPMEVIDVSETKREEIKKYDRRKKVRFVQPMASVHDLPMMNSEQTEKLPSNDLLEPHTITLDSDTSNDLPNCRKKKLHKLHPLNEQGGEAGIGKQLNLRRSPRTKDPNCCGECIQQPDHVANVGQDKEYRLRNRRIKFKKDKEGLTSPTPSPDDENQQPVEPCKRRGRPPKRKRDDVVEETFANPTESVGCDGTMETERNEEEVVFVLDSVGDDEQKLQKGEIKKRQLGRPPKHRKCVGPQKDEVEEVKGIEKDGSEHPKSRHLGRPPGLKGRTKIKKFKPKVKPS